MKFGKPVRIVLTVAGAAGVVAALVYGFMPSPVDVDLVTVERGRLTVTINEDGRTRVRERYVVAAPLPGRLLRTSLHSGEPVIAGETIVAVIEASDVTLLDDRERAESEARLKASQAHQQQAAALITRAEDALAVARNELSRAESLHAKGAMTDEAYEASTLKHRLAENDVRVAEFNLKIAEFERDQAQAAFVRFTNRPEGLDPLFRHEIRAPISGKVFRVFEENATPISTGDRLIELGDPHDLEVEIDVLSSDAVKIQPGAKVWLHQWGGKGALDAQVRLIEPSAFTKVSALGIEEQRVWVIADIVTPRETQSALGDGYRVEASILIWESPDTLRVPAGAVFRRGSAWMVFAVENSRAVLRAVEIGATNGTETEIIKGLQVNEQVILHPSDRVEPGVRVVPRPNSAGSQAAAS